MLTKSEVTVAGILQSAEELFVERHYAEVTMDQIAEKSRITKGGLYHHFSSKEQLYLAMMHADLEHKRQVLGTAINAGSGCRDRLARLTSAFFYMPKAKRGLIRLVRRDINIFGEPARSTLVKAYQQALPNLVESAIRDGIRDGELASNDARILAWHFVAMVEVTLSQYAQHIFNDTKTRLNHVLDLFFNGCSTTREVPSNDE